MESATAARWRPQRVALSTALMPARPSWRESRDREEERAPVPVECCLDRGGMNRGTGHRQTGGIERSAVLPGMTSDMAQTNHFDRSVVENQVELLTEGMDANSL